MDPTLSQYGDAVSQTTQNVSGGGLPATGLDLLFLIVVAALFIAVGFALMAVSERE